jgi:hypothetical protein
MLDRHAQRIVHVDLADASRITRDRHRSAGVVDHE